MQAHEERSGGADKKAVKHKDKDSQPKPSTKKDSESSPPASLGERLRQWGRDKDWHQSGRILNSLSLKRAYGKLIGEVSDEFLSRGLVKPALQVKADFEALLDKVKRFDVHYHQGCVDEYQAQACELLQEQIHTAIDDLAALLDNRDLGGESTPCKTHDVITPTRPIIKTAHSTEQWMSFAHAAQILAVSKATVSNWAGKGKIRDNDQRGQKRRLLVTDILLVKHEIEIADLARDADEIRADAQRIPSRH